MGAWGPGLYQDDVAEDVKTEYVNLLKSGISNQEATERLIKDNQLVITDSDNAPIFWFALADTQWKLGRLLPQVKDKALEYLINGDNLRIWEHQDKKEVKYRKKVLQNLEEQLKSPMPEERKITKYKYFKCKWKIGDTFAFRLESEYAKSSNLYGHYIIINKVDEFNWKKGEDMDIFPIVYTKITKTLKLPKNLNEINDNCDFIRYLYNPVHKKFKYKTKNNTNSSKLLKNLVYLGNYYIQTPKDEYIEDDKRSLEYDNMKLMDFEERKIIEYLKLKDK
jgi:hypothetical protein